MFISQMDMLDIYGLFHETKEYTSEHCWVLELDK